jgi:hypothetical protein
MDQSKSVNIDLLLEGKQSYNLADLYQDKELYKEYPSLQYYTVKIVEDDKRGGYLDFNNRVIAIEKGNFEEYSTLVKSGQISKDDYTYVKEVAKIKTAKTLIHEIQHAIQTIENFAQGGSPSIVLPEDIAKLKKLYDQYSDAVDAFNNLPYQDRLTPYGKHLRDEAIRLENEYLTAHDNAKIGLEGYMRLAGEVESRNVEYRLDTDYKQRPPRLTLAEVTEDVKRGDQILITEEHLPWKANNINSEYNIYTPNFDSYRLPDGRVPSLQQLGYKKKETTSLNSLSSEIRNALIIKGWTEEMFNKVSQRERDIAIRCASF